MIEIWKPVKGYEQAYEVSSFGKVRTVARIMTRKNGKQLTIPSKDKDPVLTSKGYLRVTLCFNGSQRMHLVHRLVAEAFLDPVAGSNQVNHKDGMKTHNHVSNLEWVTDSQNQRHSLLNGLQPTKLTVEQVSQIKGMLKDKTLTQSEIAQRYGVNQTTISFINRKATWVDV